MSRRNATFWSKVGETGVGETGVGEQGISPFMISKTHKCPKATRKTAKVCGCESAIFRLLSC